ncbi:uncharacterized protein LKV04_004871 [Tautogolabrus adspersus]
MSSILRGGVTSSLLSSLTILYNALLSLITFMFCLTLFLVHRARVKKKKKDFCKLQWDIILQLNQPRSEGVIGKMAKMSQTKEDLKPSALQRAQSSLKFSSRRGIREQSSCRGNKLEIPWTVSSQQGNAISQKENRIVVQEDGYYLVFGQVLLTSQSTVMGDIIQSWSSTQTELLRCLQEMPDHTPANTCYTADQRGTYCVAAQKIYMPIVLKLFVA